MKDGRNESQFEKVPRTPTNCSTCGCQMVWEHPSIPGLFLESSCYIGGSTCYSCMTEHCTNTTCLGCRVGKWPDCEYQYLKRVDGTGIVSNSEDDVVD